ncbi:MAG: NPCBM/NEW2 domain-containing protein, partial [Armatimonadota bacterium]
MRIESIALLICIPLIVSLSSTAFAIKPTRNEMVRMHTWVKANFMRVTALDSPNKAKETAIEPGLIVQANNGDILFNGRPDGRKLKIADVEYPRGLLCHAVSQVVVKLPGPGKTFNSIIGVDTNANGGSIIFSVKVNGKESFRSPVMHCSEPGIPISVDLNSAQEFIIAVEDAGDGITCDHADWADAQVTLQDEIG